MEITQAEHDALKASVAKLEEKNRVLITEKGTAKAEEQKAIDEAKKVADEAARKSGDTKALDKSWQDKYDTDTGALKDTAKGYLSTIDKMTAKAAARKMAADIAIPGSSEVLMPHIECRLKTEMTDGSPIVRVLDKAGQPSAMSIADLQKEISEDKAFAPLIVGSKANGVGLPGDKQSPAGKTVKREVFDGWDDRQRMTFIKDGGRPFN